MLVLRGVYTSTPELSARNIPSGASSLVVTAFVEQSRAGFSLGAHPLFWLHLQNDFLQENVFEKMWCKIGFGVRSGEVAWPIKWLGPEFQVKQINNLTDL